MFEFINRSEQWCVLQSLQSWYVAADRVAVMKDGQDGVMVLELVNVVTYLMRLFDICPPQGFVPSAF